MSVQRISLVQQIIEMSQQEETKILYHYTNQEGLSGILMTNQLNPSLKSENDKDARYGDGQYFSDIIPKTKTSNQLSRKFIGIPYRGDKYTNYLEIDVTGLNIIQARDGVYVHPSQEPLVLTARIVSVGEN